MGKDLGLFSTNDINTESTRDVYDRAAVLEETIGLQKEQEAGSDCKHLFSSSLPHSIGSDLFYYCMHSLESEFFHQDDFKYTKSIKKLASFKECLVCCLQYNNMVLFSLFRDHKVFQGQLVQM